MDTSDRLKGLEVTMSEGTRRRRSFPDAFKREAVAAIRGGRPVSQVAAELGLPDRLVRSWLCWAEEHAAEASGAPAPTPSRAQAAPARRVGPEPGRSGSGDRAAAQGARARTDGARHLKASGAHLRPGDGPKVSYMFIHDHVADFPVQVMCEVLGVSRGGYYAWASRAESPRAAGDRALAAEIRAAHEASRGRYGSPRVHAELRARGRRIGRKRVARLMRGMGLAARRRRRFRRTTDSRHAFPIAPNLLERNFTAEAPDRIWLADLTYICDGAGLALSRRRARPLHPPRGGLGHGRPPRA